MSTRSVIGVYNKDGATWKGRYVHFDGYPTGVGKWIYEEIRRHFADKIPDFFDKIMAETVGWSCLCGSDFTKLPSWNDNIGGSWDEDFPPQSYRARGEDQGGPDGTFITSDSEDDIGTEWAYIWTENTSLIDVYERLSYGWQKAGMINVEQDPMFVHFALRK